MLLSRLHEGKLDAALLALPVHDDQLHSEFLFEEPFVLAVPENHPLAQRDSLSLAELTDQKLLLLEDGHCLREQALEVCRLSGANEKSEFRATSLETLRQMVAANVGITLLPTLAVKPPVARSPNIHLLGFSDSHPSRRIAMLWRRSSAMNGFLLELSRVFSELPAELFSPAPEIPGAGKPSRGKGSAPAGLNRRGFRATVAAQPVTRWAARQRGAPFCYPIFPYPIFSILIFSFDTFRYLLQGARTCKPHPPVAFPLRQSRHRSSFPAAISIAWSTAGLPALRRHPAAMALNEELARAEVCLRTRFRQAWSPCIPPSNAKTK